MTTIAARLHIGSIQQVVFQVVLNGLIPLHSSDRIGGANLSVQGYGKVQQEVGVVANAAIVEIDQMGQRFHLMILAAMVEPTRSHRDITFASQPVGCVLVAISALLE